MIFGYNALDLTSVLLLALAPSLIWLFFYLKEDPHPEPRFWLGTMFAMGIILAPIVISFEMIFGKIIGTFADGSLAAGLLLFCFAPLVEETAKYGTVHLAMNKNPVIDEPVDPMIYVITAALGFAAIENVFAVFSFIPVGDPGYLYAAFNFLSMRFITAVALHGLASSISGYYFAKFYFFERKARLIFKGVIFASIFHGAYNFLIVRNGATLPTILAAVLLGGGAAAAIIMFHKLKYPQTYQQPAVDETRAKEI